ncbi:Retrieval of early ER protein Rer1 [Dillenia turbinata]|uniref:Retrieval of early ER protein Rer1 n=1 Tax=Dillenia turbinata TaxID=194707 RepID=A0AAN8UFF7_9MAGN
MSDTMWVSLSSSAIAFLNSMGRSGAGFGPGDVSRNHLNQSFLEVMLSQERFKKGFAFLNSRKIQTLILMEGVRGDGVVAITPLAALKDDFARAFQYYLDKSTPLPTHRWLGALAVTTIYVLRVYYLQGFYTMSYGLGIYILNLLIGFLSPKVDPKLEVLDGASLPTKESDEIKPFYSLPS